MSILEINNPNFRLREINRERSRDLVNLLNSSNPELRIGTLRDKALLNEAALRLKNGEVVASQMWGVFGLWIDGSHEGALERVALIKRRPNKTLRSMIVGEDFGKLVDLGAVHRDIRHLFENISSLQERTGALFHIRVPILEEAVKKYGIPHSLLSELAGTRYIQNLDPTGHADMTEFIKQINQAKVPFVGVTSMNDTKQAEIVSDKEAREFAGKKGIPLLLHDKLYNQPKVKGSFTIIDATSLQILREGNIPAEAVEDLLEVRLDRTKMKQAHYQSHDYSGLLEKGGPVRKRTIALLYLQGFTEDTLRAVNDTTEAVDLQRKRI